MSVPWVSASDNRKLFIMSLQVVFKYPVIFCVGFIITFVLTPVVRRVAVKLGIVDLPDDRRIHEKPTPRCGGIAVFLGFHAACAVIFLIPWMPFHGYLNIHWWWRFLLVSSLLLAVGLVDDVKGIKPVAKLSGQLVAAVLLFVFDMRFGKILGFDIPLPLDLAATILWVLAITNAFNLIDGIDGLAAGLALIGALGIAGGLLFRYLPGDVLVCLGFMGACLAFLRYNFHPSSIFLGDSGSMFLGFTLAAIALSTGSKGTAMASIGVPLLAVGIPIFDTMLAIWRRSVRGLFRKPGKNPTQAVMQADKEHLHHRLIKSGLSQRAVATWLYAISAFLVAVAMLGLICRTYALGIFLIAFAAGAYVVVKHLARVELWDSASAVLYGLRRPTTKVMAVLFYPLVDVGMLVLAFGIAVWLSRPELGGADLKRVWIDGLPVWGGISFVALICARTYRRVWSLSRVSEVMGLGLALMFGIVLSLGIFVLIGHSLSRRVILQTVLYAGIAVPMIVGSRVSFRALQDILEITARHPTLAGNRTTRKVLLYGVGSRCTLFLRERSFKYPSIADERRVVGLLDDDLNLHGRLVYGYPVLGGIKQLPSILQKQKIAEFVITAELQEFTKKQLVEIAAQYGIRISEWRTEERVVLA